ncbi:substrate-binding domain-containing protein [Vibrio diazotrophicus]|uniref:substrate-binding domain-containing protein n=1 Tax=Vibrio diazotrophicus TaxID=685 RepID=UPI00142D1D21|nr:substrate-binding domain-containing protein [Vibrio diazotrophicus]NIY93132.1 substrate-binding domain-containing protein [Vibrio diazotrophicus]
MKKPTIYDIARLAGVSVSTVSRYSNRKAYICKDKVRAIEQAMFELNFKPKNTKISTNRLRSMKIGVVIPTFDNSYFSCILNGMNHWAQNSAYSLRIESSNFSKVREQKTIKQMMDVGVDALVLIVNLSSEDEIKQLVGDLPILVVAGSNLGTLPSIKIDNVIAGSIATNHLIQLGHTKIVHAHGRLDEGPDAGDRLKGYKKSLLEAGLNVDENLIVNGGYYFEYSYQAINELLSRGVEFTAVFAANDLSAYGVIQALKEHELGIPEDVSVIGFDDLYTSAICNPSLTTIRQPLYEMGELAMQYICDLTSMNASLPHVPPVELIKRESSGPVKS